MNVFDVLDNLDLLPKRLAGTLALVAIVGIAYVPPIRNFYLEQARLRGDEIARVIMKAWPEPPAKASR